MISTIPNKEAVKKKFTATWQQAKFWDWLQHLPTAYRTVFNLYVLEGYPHKEIATMLGISEGTSRANLSYANKELRKLLAGWAKRRAFEMKDLELHKLVRESLQELKPEYQPSHWRLLQAKMILAPIKFPLENLGGDRSYCRRGSFLVVQQSNGTRYARA